MFRKKCGFFIIIILVFSLIGCNNNSKSIEKEISKINLPLPNTLIVDHTKSDFLTLENKKLKKIELGVKEQVIGFTDNILITKTRNNESDNINFYRNNKEFKTNFEGNLVYIKISKDCLKALYKVQLKEEVYEYGIADLETGNKNKIQGEIVISGNTVDFIDNSNVMFYGADTVAKVSGLYKYNLQEKKFTLEYKISESFIEYFKPISEDSIFYLVSNFSGEKSSYIYSIKDKKAKLFSKDIIGVKDVISSNGQIFILGTSKNNSFSLYSMKGNKLSRLVYDFPKFIDEDTILVEYEGNILFQGHDGDISKGNIFAYNIIDKSTNIISIKDSEYELIKKSDKY